MLQRNTACGTIVFVDFAASGNSREFHGTGWSGQEPDSVWTTGARSTLTLPGPLGQDGFVLDLDVNPCVALPAVQGQLLSVHINGHPLGWCRLTGPSRVKCRITPEMLRGGPSGAGAGAALGATPGAVPVARPIELSFGHPCFVRADLLGGAGDPRPLAIRFFHIGIYPDALSATIDQLMPLRRDAAPVALHPPIAHSPSRPADPSGSGRVEHEFGAGKAGTAYLREGWHNDPEGLVWTAAPFAAIELPAPLGQGAHRLRIGLAPLVIRHLMPAQRITIIVDGLLLGQFRLAVETSLSIPLPAELVGMAARAGAMMKLVFVLPDGVPMHDFANGQPGQVLGAALDRIVIEPVPAQLRHAATLRCDDLDAPAPLAVSERFADLPAEELRAAIEAELGIGQEELMRGFESLGDNCAFGLAQRKAGAEVLGLLRFANTPLRALLRGLADGFKAAVTAAEISLYLHPDEPREYMLAIRRYGIRWHTMVHEPDADAATVQREQTMKLGFLRRKFAEGLQSGRKIYSLVRSQPDRIAVVMPAWDAPPVAMDDHTPLYLDPVWDAPLTYEEPPPPLYLAEALSVLLELNRHGPNTLLYFVPCPPGRRAGTVELLAPGLMRGYMSSFVTLANQATSNDLDWIRVAANAWLLNRDANAMTRPAQAA